MNSYDNSAVLSGQLKAVHADLLKTAVNRFCDSARVHNLHGSMCWWSNIDVLLQVLSKSRDTIVLACAPSNSAADLILERVSTQGVIPATQMIRLNAFGRPEASVNIKVKVNN